MKAMMKNKGAGSLLRSKMVSALGLIGLFGLTLGNQGFAREAAYKAGEVIVKYRSDVNRDRVSMNALYDELGVTEVKRYRGIMKGIEQLVFSPEVSVKERVAQLNQNPLVEYAQPNYILYALPEQVDTKDGDQPPGVVFLVSLATRFQGAHRLETQETQVILAIRGVRSHAYFLGSPFLLVARMMVRPQVILATLETHLQPIRLQLVHRQKSTHQWLIQASAKPMELGKLEHPPLGSTIKETSRWLLRSSTRGLITTMRI